MGKKIYLAVIWIITLAVVIFGIAIHCTGFGLPFSRGSEKKEEVNLNESISSIYIDADVAELSIAYGNELKVEYNYPSKIAPSIEIEDGELNITQKTKGASTIFGNNKYKLNLTIPKDTSLTAVTVKVDYGEINIKDVICDKFNLEASAGDIEIKNVTADAADMVLNMGDLDVQNSTIITLKANCDMGDIDVDGDFEVVDVHCDMGDVDINTDKETSQVNIKAHCDLGTVNVNGEKW